MSARLAYSLLWLLALPAVLIRLAWRARRQPAYLDHVGERFGRYALPTTPHTVWVHAVSVGETRAAKPLVDALLQDDPDCSVLLTHMTPTGRETAQTLFGDNPRVRSAYLPYDLPWSAAAFLKHFRPRLGVIMETELWPNLLAACARNEIPVLLANARLSERSARRYARWPRLTRLTLGALSAIGAQTDADAARLRDLGAEGVRVTGNIKFDLVPPEDQLRLGDELKAQIGHRPVVLAASTREGEEGPILDAFLAQASPDALLTIVPRHPQRFDEVAELVRTRGARLQRRSEAQPLERATRVFLGDSMGEMFAYFRCADVALMGGSWEPLGGQNLIEACAVGTPVVLGPHTFNFAQISEQAIAAGAAFRAGDAGAGMRLALDLLADEKARAAAGEAGRRFTTEHRGATHRTLELAHALQAHVTAPSRA